MNNPCFSRMLGLRFTLTDFYDMETFIKQSSRLQKLGGDPRKTTFGKSTTYYGR